MIPAFSTDTYIPKIDGLPHRGDPETRFGLGSFTKTYIAYLILKLHEEGKLDLDNTIDKWVYHPDYPLDSVLPYTTTYKNRIHKDILIRHLVNHSAKVRDFDSELMFALAVVSDLDKKWSVADSLSYIPFYWFWGDPLYDNNNVPDDIDNNPEYILYSGSHYVFLGSVVKQAIKKAFPDNSGKAFVYLKNTDG